MEIHAPRDNVPVAFDQRDFTRIVSRMKRRMAPQEGGNYLVAELQQFQKESYPIKRNVKVDRLNDISKEFYEFFTTVEPEISEIANFQYEGMRAVVSSLNELKKSVIVNAPTGSGKTLVFMIPPLYNSSTTGKSNFFIYPRISLIYDQLKTIIKYAFLVNHSHKFKRELSIGILHGNIGPTDDITIEYSREDIFDQRANKLKFKNLVCPLCGNGELYANVLTYKGKKTIGDSKFKCSNNNCDLEIKILISKEKYRDDPPQIILTTIDTLASFMFKSEVKGALDRASAMILDESHVYHSIYGSLVSNLIRTVHSFNPNISLIMASATIPNPIEFAEKLTGIQGSQIKLIEAEGDERDISHPRYEIYRILKSTSIQGRGSNSLSTLIQLLLLTSHSVYINGKQRVLVFFDTKDVLKRTYYDLNDALDRKLARYRIDKEHFLALDSYKCPKQSENSCDLKTCGDGPYGAGECWFGLTKAYFGNSTRPKSDNPKIAYTLSENRFYKPDSDVVLTTAVSELGIDDKQAHSVMQYRAPYTIYELIQRKGRAGRDINQGNVDIWLVLGNDPPDLFYFNNLERLLIEDYHLPLNPDNPFCRWVNLVYKKIGEMFENDDKGEYEGQQYQIDFQSIYKTLIDKVLCSDYLDFLNQNNLKFPPSLIKNLRLTNVGDAIKRIRGEIQSLLKDTNGKDPMDKLRDYNESISVNEMQQYSDLTERLDVAVQENNIEAVKELVSQIRRLIDGLSSELKIDTIDAKKIHTVLTEFFGHNDPTAIFIHLNRLRARQRSLEELESAFQYWDTFSILKNIYRSWFFFHHSSPESHVKDCRAQKMELYPLYLMPLSLFGSGENISLKIDEEISQDAVSFTDLGRRYLPHRLPYRNSSDFGDANRLAVKYSLSENQPGPKGTSYITLKIDEYDEEVTPNGERYWNPRLVNMTSLRGNDKNNTVKSCPRCLRVFDSSRDVCTYDNTELVDATIYSEGVTDSIIVDSKGLDELFGMLKEKITYVRRIKGENVIFFSDNDGNPIRFLRKFRFDPVLGRKKDNITAVRINLKKLDSSKMRSFDKFPGGSEDEILETYAHSVAHLFVKAVSFLSGVSTEYLTYFVESHENGSHSVYVYEDTESDTGVIDSFYASVIDDPVGFYDTLTNLSHCRTHDIDLSISNDNDNSQGRRIRLDLLSNSGISTERAKDILREYEKVIGGQEKADFKKKDDSYKKVVQCYDGCPDCMFLANCSDKEAQNGGELVSRTYAADFVSSLKIELSKEEFTHKRFDSKLASARGFIYEKSGNKIYWVEL